MKKIKLFSLVAIFLIFPVSILFGANQAGEGEYCYGHSDCKSGLLCNHSKNECETEVADFTPIRKLLEKTPVVTYKLKSDGNFELKVTYNNLDKCYKDIITIDSITSYWNFYSDGHLYKINDIKYLCSDSNNNFDFVIDNANMIQTTKGYLRFTRFYSGTYGQVGRAGETFIVPGFTEEQIRELSREENVETVSARTKNSPNTKSLVIVLNSAIFDKIHKPYVKIYDVQNGKKYDAVPTTIMGKDNILKWTGFEPDLSVSSNLEFQVWVGSEGYYEETRIFNFYLAGTKSPYEPAEFGSTVNLVHECTDIKLKPIVERLTMVPKIEYADYDTENCTSAETCETYGTSKLTVTFNFDSEQKANDVKSLIVGDESKRLAILRMYIPDSNYYPIAFDYYDGVSVGNIENPTVDGKKLKFIKNAVPKGMLGNVDLKICYDNKYIGPCCYVASGSTTPGIGVSLAGGFSSWEYDKPKSTNKLGATGVIERFVIPELEPVEPEPEEPPTEPEPKDEKEYYFKTDATVDKKENTEAVPVDGEGGCNLSLSNPSILSILLFGILPITRKRK